MLELFKESLAGQFHAALSMLNGALVQCPQDAWSGKVGNFPFWHVAYHALFYTDLYLSPHERSFRPADFHRENYQFFGRQPWPPYQQVVAEEPYERDVLLEYVQLCRTKASRSLAAETAESLAGPCGFWWYKIPRAEFYVNNVRHLQHHAAQMSLYLRKEAEIDIGWAASGFKQ